MGTDIGLKVSLNKRIWAAVGTLHRRMAIIYYLDGHLMLSLFCVLAPIPIVSDHDDDDSNSDGNRRHQYEFGLGEERRA